MVSKNVSDSGAGIDALHVRRATCSYAILNAACAAVPGPFYAWAHSSVVLPDALVVFYSEGSPNLRFDYSADGGTTWNTTLIPASWTGANVSSSAVADTCTQDIHIVYGEVGDPELTDTLNNSVWYRKLTYIGSPGLPAWSIGDAVEIALGSAGIGYATPILAVQRRGCGHTGSVDEGDGRLIMMCLRKTFTTRSWALFTATAPWTLQGAAETIAAIPTASGDDRAGLAQIDDRAYALTYAGGVYALYRSGELDWGEDAAVFTAVDGFSGDVNEGFGLASDVLESSTDKGSDVVAARQVAAAYVKDSQVHMREWYVPITGDVTVTDRMIWPIKNAYQASISRVGTTFRVTAIVGTPASAARSVIYSDGPFYNAWLAIAEDLVGGKDWKWLGVPEHATSGYNWCAAWGRDDLLPGVVEVWVGRCPMAVYQLLNEPVVGVDVALLEIPLTDSALGTDAVTFVIKVTEIPGGVDTVKISLELEDEGEGQDIVAKGHLIVDSGLGAELLNIALAVADANVGVVEALRIGVSVTDIGGGVEVLSDYPSLVIAETGVGDEALGLVVSVTETGAGVDIPTVGVRVTETPTGSEVVSLIFNVADEGVADDVLGKIYKAIDSASGDDILGLLLPLTDAGTGDEELKIIFNITDTGIGVDQVNIAIAVARMVLRLLVAKGVLRLHVKGPGL